MAKILFIEDESGFAQPIKMLLEKNGHQVEHISDGQAGLERAKTYHPDLILLDIILPRLDGYKICEWLKADPAYKKIPVIMLTKRTSEIEQKVGFAAGADEYLTKPCDQKLLISKINQLLKT